MMTYYYTTGNLWMKGEQGKVKTAWWVRLFHRERQVLETESMVEEGPDERELTRMLFTLKEKIRTGYEERTLDNEIYDECRYLLFRLDLLLPYALITPYALKERIIRLIAEDAFGTLEPYLSLHEESRRNVRGEIVRALRCMAAEAARIVGAIQEYEREVFSNRAAFVSKWYEKK
jgi:hypothetical protein